MAKTWKTLLIYRIMEREVRRSAAKYLTGRLIDIGCGTKPYYHLVAPGVSEYIGLDRDRPFNKAAKTDLVGTAYEIPVGDAHFDCALSTATLEHLAEPEQALRECHRVLKPGGFAVYTVPLIWHLHAEPHDFFRYTKYGLAHLFRKVGFDVVEVRPMAGFPTTFATLLCYYIGRWHRGPLRYVPVIPLIGLVAQGIAALAERLDTTEEWTWMYTVVARKPMDADVQHREAA
ncbi:MAG: methyltransferase domain-containing protein [Planctomycetia bacterium]|nr:methyltransferase domain-containing protein [Planctomycetia bacterium]